MDREISKNEQRRAAGARFLKIALPVLVAGGIVWWLAATFGGASVSERELVFGTAERGDLTATVSAGGKIVPAYEEVINSPISSRILEVRHRPGDKVEAGTSLLVLDLEATRIETQKMADNLRIKRLELDQQKTNDRTALSRLDMEIKVGAMKVRRLEAELDNERYLDSIGSGTTDKVREAEFALRSAELELEQLRRQRINEEDVRRAAADVKQLELDILAGEVALAQRTLTEADIRAPRRGTVTTLNTTIGTQISQGQALGAVADLNHFKVEGEVADAHAGSVVPGSKAIVRVGSTDLSGTVTAVAPAANSGLVGFTISLDCDSAAMLRPGLRPAIHVIDGLKTDVLRIPNGSFYQGSGAYNMYVRTADGSALELRRINLGEASMDHVEVTSGLNAGEQIVVSDLDRFKGKEKIKIK